MSIDYSFFQYEEEEWIFDMELLRHLEKTYGVPFYLFDEIKAIRNVRTLQACMGTGIQLAYAMKANPWITETISHEVEYIEVCSAGELNLCKKHNIPGEKIVLSGVFRDKDLLAEAVQMNIKRICADSVEQFTQIIEMVNDDEEQEVLLRVSSGNQFGMTQEEVCTCVALCRENSKKRIEIIGFQFYPGTQRQDMYQVKKDLDKLRKWVGFFEQIPEFRLRIIEFGAGIGVPYFENENTGEYRKIVDIVVRTASELLQNYEIIYESGRLIAATSGIYVTSVFQKKERNGKQILFCQGGSNHLRYHGGILGVRVPQICAISADCSGEKTEYMICGSLCSESDILVQKSSKLDRLVTVGDYLVFLNAGAYTGTETPILFLAMEMPAVLLYNKNNVELKIRIKGVRRRIPTYQILEDGLGEKFEGIRQDFEKNNGNH